MVACCWMIKIGFVRASEGEGIVGAMKVMERVIDVIRRRRRWVLPSSFWSGS